MLRFLDVRHLAVIDHLEVELEPGLNVLTGETGAGKSILIEAIELLVGGRASADLVRTGADHAIVQAVFDDLDGREVLVRREISAHGRSRAFIDDALATTAALRELGARLVDLHGQHEHQSLLTAESQAAWLDAYLDAPDLVDEVGRAFDAYRAAERALERSQLDDREKRARIDIAEFQLHEIGQVAPEAGEDEALDAERTVLQNADRLVRLSSEAYAALYEGDHAALASLATAWKRIADLAALDSRFVIYLEQRDGVKSALEDLAFFLRDYSAHLEGSPVRLQSVEDRLAALTRLKRKFGPTLDDVIARAGTLQEELAELGASEARVASLESEAAKSREIFVSLARDLSGRRLEAARSLSRHLETSVAQLAMPHARFDIRVTALPRADAWTRSGVDQVEIHLSPNPGEDLRPLSRIASGGELSRIMLALHDIARAGPAGRTLIFDEIDAGIGGSVGSVIGTRLQHLGVRDQILCITHLATVAARADAHFAVTKTVSEGRTSTALRRLDADGREQELARMIAGASVEAQARATAAELLRAGTRGESESNSKGESPQMAKGERRRVAKAKGRRREA